MRFIVCHIDRKTDVRLQTKPFETFDEAIAFVTKHYANVYFISDRFNDVDTDQYRGTIARIR